MTKMRLSNKDLKLVIPFMLFVTIGVYGLYSVEYISVSQTMKATFKWCIIPITLFSIYYGYQSSFGSKSLDIFWKKIILFILMFCIILMMTFTSFQGLLMLINQNIGEQVDYKLCGKIVKLNYPKEKKIANKYSIFIIRDVERDTIELNVPTNEYVINQKFEKDMKIGSLKFIYSKN